MRRTLDDVGAEAGTITGVEFGRFVGAEIARFRELVRAANIKMDG